MWVAAFSLLHASGEIVFREPNLNFTAGEAVLWPCSSRKVGKFPSSNLRLIRKCMQQPPPVTVKHFLSEEPRPAVISSSLLTRYGLPLGDNGIPGNSECNT